MFDFAEKRPADIPIVVLDTETTGLEPGLGHRVVEIGAVRLETAGGKPWQVTAEMSQLINPGRRMDPAASRINGIYDSDLASAPSFHDVQPDLLQLVDGALLVAHNARFDADFLGIEFYIEGMSGQQRGTRGNLPSQDRGQELGGTQEGSLTAVLEAEAPIPLNPWLCTLQLARRHFHFGRNSLAHIAKNLGVRMGRAHRALNDVYMTAEVLKRMVRVLAGQRLETVGDLMYAQGGPIHVPAPPHVYLPPPLDEAMAAGRSLKILYLGEAGETRRVIRPHYAAEHEGVAYLIAFCHLRQDIRTFRLDRIFSAELL